MQLLPRFPGILALGEASCHIVSSYGEPHVEQKLQAKSVNHLGVDSAGLVNPADNSNLSQHLAATALEIQSQNTPTEQTPKLLICKD